MYFTELILHLKDGQIIVCTVLLLAYINDNKRGRRAYLRSLTKSYATDERQKLGERQYMPKGIDDDRQHHFGRDLRVEKQFSCVSGARFDFAVACRAHQFPIAN